MLSIFIKTKVNDQIQKILMVNVTSTQYWDVVQSFKDNVQIEKWFPIIFLNIQNKLLCSDHVLNSREDLSKDNLAIGVRKFPFRGNFGVELPSPRELHHQV